MGLFNGRISKPELSISIFSLHTRQVAISHSPLQDQFSKIIALATISNSCILDATTILQPRQSLHTPIKGYTLSKKNIFSTPFKLVSLAGHTVVMHVPCDFFLLPPPWNVSPPSQSIQPSDSSHLNDVDSLSVPLAHSTLGSIRKLNA